MTVSNLNYKVPTNDESGTTLHKDEIRTLLEDNRKLLEEVLKNTKKMNHFIISQQIFSILKIIIIVVPLVLGYMYLTPLLQDALSQYQEIMGMTNEAMNINAQLEGVSPEVLKRLLK